MIQAGDNFIVGGLNNGNFMGLDLGSNSISQLNGHQAGMPISCLAKF
jgi:hypothetical protein